MWVKVRLVLLALAVVSAALAAFDRTGIVPPGVDIPESFMIVLTVFYLFAGAFIGLIAIPAAVALQAVSPFTARRRWEAPGWNKSFLTFPGLVLADFVGTYCIVLGATFLPIAGLVHHELSMPGILNLSFGGFIKLGVRLSMFFHKKRFAAGVSAKRMTREGEEHGTSTVCRQEKLQMWLRVRILFIVLAVASGVVSTFPRPVIVFSGLDSWVLNLLAPCFVLFGLVSVPVVVGFQIKNPFAGGSWHKPGWRISLFAMPGLAFADFFAITTITHGLAVLVTAALQHRQLDMFGLMTVAFGLSIKFGVRFSMFLHRNRFDADKITKNRSDR